MKYYEIQQTVATGNGSSTTYVLVTNPKVDGCGIHATKVGEVNWLPYARFADGRTHNYKKIEPKDFFVVGNAICEEIEEPFD